MLDINFSPFPVLSTERLTLRQLNDRDIPQLFSLRSDERVMEFVDRPLAKSEEEVADLIILINKSMQNNEAITWSVTLKDDTKLIGTICFWKLRKNIRGPR
jgi:ribosomal-protein-alanine N-acetyltransferase